MDIPGLSSGPDGIQMDAPKDGKIPMPEGLATDGTPTFIVFKTETCQWCHRTMDFLKALHEERGDFQVAVVDANGQPDSFRQVTAYTRRSTVPQIFLDGRFVGGWDDLARAAKAGQLDAYLDGGDWKAVAPASTPKKRWWQRDRD